MITDLFDSNIAKILALFSISPGSRFTRKELKEKTLLHNVPLDLSLKKLLHTEVLLQEHRHFALNFRNDAVNHILAMLKQEYKGSFKEIPLKIYSILIDLSSMVLSSDISSIILFGSYAKLIYTEKSDIDLAFILKEEKKAVKEKVSNAVRKLEKKYSKIIEPHFFLEEDMKKQDRLIEEIKKNGVKLF